MIRHIHYAATPQIFIEDKYLQSNIIRTKDNKVCVEEENLQKIGLAFNRLVLSIPYDNGNIL